MTHRRLLCNALSLDVNTQWPVKCSWTKLHQSELAIMRGQCIRGVKSQSCTLKADQPFFNVFLEEWSCGNSLTTGIKAAYSHVIACFKKRFLRVLETSLCEYTHTISENFLMMESKEFFWLRSDLVIHLVIHITVVVFRLELKRHDSHSHVCLRSY